MKNILIAALCSTALVSCETTKIDIVLQKNSPTICKVIETVHASFVAANTINELPPKLVDKEAKAYAFAAPLCIDPENLTAAQVLLVTAQQLIILKAAKEARELHKQEELIK